MMEKTVVTFSGGLDSTTLLFWASKQFDVTALTFDYGSKHNKRELAASKEITNRLKIPHVVVKLPFLNQFFKSNLLRSGGEIPEGHYQDSTMRSTVVPFRNGIILSIAVGYAESIDAKTVLYAAHAGDHAVYPDCRPGFLKAISEAAHHGTYLGVKIEDPFIDMTKAEIASLGKNLGVPFEVTYSCYKGGKLHCGKCGTCVERKEAFRLAGIPDPTEYKK